MLPGLLPESVGRDPVAFHLARDRRANDTLSHRELPARIAPEPLEGSASLRDFGGVDRAFHRLAHAFEICLRGGNDIVCGFSDDSTCRRFLWHTFSSRDGSPGVH